MPVIAWCPQTAWCRLIFFGVVGEKAKIVENCRNFETMRIGLLDVDVGASFLNSVVKKRVPLLSNGNDSSKVHIVMEEENVAVASMRCRYFPT